MGPVFHRYEDGFRFATLSRAVADKYGFSAIKAYFAMECACLWSRPIHMAVDFIRLTLRSAIEASDLSYACISSFRLVTDLLLQGSPLDEVWGDLQAGLEFSRRAKFRGAADVMTSQQLIIGALRGSPELFSGFAEHDFEAQLNAEKTPLLACWHWISSYRTDL